MILFFFDKSEVEEYQYTQHYSVPAEHLEIVLFDVVHQELDNEH